MVVCFQGKGGAGKSTLSALYAQWLAARGIPTLYIDADVNQSSGSKIGISPQQRDTMPTISQAWNDGSLKHFLLGERALSADHLLKTTPPGPGSRLFFVDPEHPVVQGLAVPTESGVFFMRTGDLGPKDQGSCAHSKTHGLESLLAHRADSRGEIVIDLMAGNDNTATSIPFLSDTNVVVCNEGEPTLAVLRQLARYAAKEGPEHLHLTAVGNDILSEERLGLFKERAETIEAHVATRSATADRYRLLCRGANNEPLAFTRNNRWEELIRDGHALTLEDLTVAERAQVDRVFSGIRSHARQARKTPAERMEQLAHFHQKNLQHYSEEQRTTLRTEHMAAELTPVTRRHALYALTTWKRRHEHQLESSLARPVTSPASPRPGNKIL